MASDWKEDTDLEDFLEEKHIEQKMPVQATLHLLRASMCEYEDCSLRTLERMINHFGLTRSAKQCSDAELERAIEEVWHVKGESAIGYRMMVDILRVEKKLCVYRKRVEDIMRRKQPDEVEARKPLLSKRKRTRGFFDCAGPNLLWSCDGNDKLSGFMKSFYDLHIYGVIDVHSRKVMILVALQGNSNPLVIGKIYYQLVRDLGYIPRRLRFDHGTETGEMATIHSYLLHHMGYDQADMEGVIPGTSITNKIERFWLTLRQKVLDNYREILKYLTDQRQYRSEVQTDRDLLAAVFIPSVQIALNNFSKVHNSHIIQTQRDIRLPTGYSPDVIYSCPDLFCTEDYKVEVSEAVFDSVSTFSTGVADFQLGIDVPDRIKNSVVEYFENVDIATRSPEELATDYIQLRRQLN